MSLFVPLSLDVKSWSFMPNSYLNFETVRPSPPPKKKASKTGIFTVENIFMTQ